MLNIDFIYIFANVLLLFLFISTGAKVSNGIHYKLFVIISIIIYSFVLGLRYDRGFDYIHYANMYQYGFTQGEQKAFVLLNSTLLYLGVSRYYVFVIYSFLEVLCSFIFLKRYKDYGKYIIPFFLISTIQFNEYAIRQALGFAFAFLYIGCLFNLHKRNISISRKIIPACLFFLVSYSIHTICGYMLVAITIVYFIYKKPIPLNISIPFLIIATYFLNYFFDMSWLDPLLYLTEGDERLSLYVNDESRFETNNDTIKYARNNIILIFELLGTISLYYFGYKTIVKWHKEYDYYLLYNLFVFGTIFLNAFRSIEILHRVGENLYLFWFFPLSIVLYHRKEILATSTSTERIMFCFLVWWGYDYMKYLFFRGEMTKFIWDI